jgi:hypothetical protein
VSRAPARDLFQPQALSDGNVLRDPFQTRFCNLETVAMARAHVYILASRMRGTLYVGVTTNLAGRIVQHREGTTGGFTVASSTSNRSMTWRLPATASAA